MDEATAKAIFDEAVAKAKADLSEMGDSQKHESSYLAMKNIREACRSRFGVSGSELDAMANQIVDRNVGAVNE